MVTRTHRLLGLGLAGAALVALATGCSGGGSSADSAREAPPRRDVNLKVDTAFADALNGFGFRLYAALSDGKEAENVFLSAPSVEMALAMTMNGARGDTLAGMSKALGVEALSVDEVNAGNAQLMAVLRNPDPGVELSIANSLWGLEGLVFDPGFLERNKKGYEADLRTVNFADPASAEAINAWVDEKTHAKIPRLFEHDTIKDAILVLANAVYFKGKWALPFDPKLTQDGPFTDAGGKQAQKPMMRQTGKFRYAEVEGTQVVSLPYGDGHVDAVVALPAAGTAPADFRKMVTAANWKTWTEALAERQGTVALPRFKLDYSTSLKAALGTLGMAVAFTDQADLTGILAPESLAALGGVPFISEVVHKTALEVNEEGTVAAAATGVVVGVTSAPVDPPFTMTVDRPFLLALRDRPTGVVLFMGVINKPE